MPKNKTVDLTVLDSKVPSLNDRLERLTDATRKLANRWGLPKAVTNPGNDPDHFQKRVYSTGLLSLDKVLKTGGIPRGHITELFGSPSAGKSLMLYQIIRSIQHTCHNCWGELEYFDAVDRKGNPQDIEKTILVRGEEQTIKIRQRYSVCKNCQSEDTGGLFCLFDQENSSSPDWMMKQGIELTKMLVLRMPTGEHALDTLRMIMNQHAVDGIGIDSISQLQPKTEQERSSVDDATMMGLHAKVMAQLCRHVASSFLEDPKNAPAFIWINQTRADVSGNGAIKVTGGYAPEFYSSIRLYMLRRAQVNQQKPEQGTNGRITVKKCKAAEGVVNRTTDYIILDQGFDTALDMYLTAVSSNVFNPGKLAGGGHYWADDLELSNKLASKRDEAIERVRTDPDFAAQLRTRTLNTHDVQIPTDIYVGDSLPGTIPITENQLELEE
jgi:RecA/RadA recombinase